MTKRTYIDANLLISAWHGRDEVGLRALELLDDPERVPIVSAAVWLEVMPKPLYFRRSLECAFYQDIFERAEHLPWQVSALEQAQDLARRYGMAAMDAIHVALAIVAGVDEFVSGEKPGKPMFRVIEIPMRSLHGDVS